MIRGKIESDREVVSPTEITFGENPYKRDENGRWISDDPTAQVVVTNIEDLVKEEFDKLVSDAAEKQTERLTSTLIDADTRARHFVAGANFARELYEKKLEAIKQKAKKK